LPSVLPNILTKLVYISSLTVVVPFLIGILRYRHLPDPARVITWLLGAWLLAEAGAQAIARMGFHNWYVFSLLSLLELVLIASFFRKIYISRSAGRVALVLAVLGIMLTLSEFIRTNEPIGTVTMLYDCMLFFGLGLYYFYEVAAEKADKKFNLITLSIMAMFLGSAAYFSSWQLMKYQEGLFRIFGAAHALLLIFCYTLFAISLWRLRSSS
jgi:hypothetical protein